MLNTPQISQGTLACQILVGGTTRLANGDSNKPGGVVAQENGSGVSFILR